MRPKWNKHGAKWSQNGAKVLLWSFLACIWESIYFLMPKWNQSGTNVDPKWSPNMRKCKQKTSTKTWSFPDTIFHGFSMILGLFLDQFFNIFLFFFKNSKKGRHAFRLRHGEWIEGLTCQFHVLRTYRRAAGGKGEAEVNASRGFMPTWRIMYKKHSLWRPRTPKRHPNK